MDKSYILYNITEERYSDPLTISIYTSFNLYNITMHRFVDRVTFICEVGSDDAIYEQNYMRVNTLAKVMELRIRFTEQAFRKNVLGTILKACKAFRKDLTFKIFHG